jgi:phosphoglycolate phosphatase-like HAD superfamily hydrolase
MRMKYFTPELYVRINAASDDEAEALHDEWEEAGQRFRRRYKKIEFPLPEALRKFHDEQCLHDADWHGIARLSTFTLPWNSQDVTIIAARKTQRFPNS